jgi:hypothetical protein
VLPLFCVGSYIAGHQETWMIMVRRLAAAAAISYAKMACFDCLLYQPAQTLSWQLSKG